MNQAWFAWCVLQHLLQHREHQTCKRNPHTCGRTYYEPRRASQEIVAKVADQTAEDECARQNGDQDESLPEAEGVEPRAGDDPHSIKCQGQQARDHPADGYHSPEQAGQKAPRHGDKISKNCGSHGGDL